jgi:hypothetical protein
MRKFVTKLTGPLKTASEGQKFQDKVKDWLSLLSGMNYICVNPACVKYNHVERYLISAWHNTFPAP